ncbi:MAG: PIN domain-containing protein [Phascolarctobacterium sp.]|nr:PIN domain-containing protein [Phascolarctobacterium sp.]
MIVLLDTCVIIDVLQDRQPFAEAAKKIFIAVANKQIEGCITAKSVADIYYLTHKATHSNEKSREILAKLFTLFSLLNTTGDDCKNALFSPIADYEDAIMVETAKNAGIDYIVTRNIKDYSKSPVKVTSPAEFLEELLS